MSRRYPKRPLVGIGVVVWRDGQVLLVRRAKPPRKGGWSLPGGAQRLGETVHQAGIREVAEETGTNVEIVGLIDTVDSIEKDGAGRIEYHYTLIDLCARWVSGQTQAASDAAEVAWFTPSELSGLGLWRETLRIIGLSERMAKKG